MIHISCSGSFKNTDRFLKRARKREYFDRLDSLAQQGLQALIQATPIDSGKTADCWSYEIKKDNGGLEITYNNSNIVDGVPIAIIIQKGHGTGTGGYVAGRDYINPAIQPIFDELADKVWKEVTK